MIFEIKKKIFSSLFHCSFLFTSQFMGEYFLIIQQKRLQKRKVMKIYNFIRMHSFDKKKLFCNIEIYAFMQLQTPRK